MAHSLFADDGTSQWLIAPDAVRPSVLMLLVVLVGGVVAAGLVKLGVVRWAVRWLGASVRWGVRTGFRVWEQTLAWAPWPLFAAVVAVLLLIGIGFSSLAPPLAAVVAVVPLFMGLVATLAYMFIDVERYEVARGYKALHNPTKGQRLAAELVRHGPAVGVPLLASAAVGMVGGFALLNLALSNLLST